MNEKKIITIRDKEIVVNIKKEYGTIKVGDLFFPCIEDFVYFVNKLTDIAEEVKDSDI